MWMTPKERAEYEAARNSRLLGEHGESNGHEWASWEKQIGLFDRMAEVTYAVVEQKQSRFNLPSHGLKYEDCGKTLVKGCTHIEDHPSGKGFGRLFKRSCGRAECPECYEAWAGKEGMKALIKIAAYCVGHVERREQVLGRKKKIVVKEMLVGFERVSEVISTVKHTLAKERSSVIRTQIAEELQNLIFESGKYIKHFVISPPQDVDWKDIDSFRECRGRAYEIAQKVGVLAGALLPHPYRMRCSKCGNHPIQDYIKECPKCGSEAFEWYYSPHFHSVGVGYLPDGATEENYEETGWIVKNCGVRQSVFWTMEYLLSHAGIRKGVHVVTWFGRLSSNRMEKTPILGSIREVCPHCGRLLKPLIYSGLEEPPPLSFDPKADSNDFYFDSGEYRDV